MWSDFITSVQCLQKLSLMMIGNICVGENKRAGRDGAHQLYTLLHINSFSCVGISPQIDWFYLPALVGRVWKWEKKCVQFIYYIVFLLQLTLCKAKLLVFFLCCLVPALEAWGCCLWPLYRETQAHALMSPCCDSSEELAVKGGGSLPEYPNCHPAPATLEAEEILPYFVIVSGFEKS